MRLKQHRKDTKGVSPVIAVVLLVAITVVLVSVLYFSVVSLTLVDGETGDAESISPLVNNGQAEAGAPGEEVQILYVDANSNNQLDSSDVFYITNGTAGDRVSLMYIPSDDLLDYYIIKS
jgi:flagellin-like protein